MPRVSVILKFLAVLVVSLCTGCRSGGVVPWPQAAGYWISREDSVVGSSDVFDSGDVFCESSEFYICIDSVILQVAVPLPRSLALGDVWRWRESHFEVVRIDASSLDVMSTHENGVCRSFRISLSAGITAIRDFLPGCEETEAIYLAEVPIGYPQNSSLVRYVESRDPW